jgi:LSD1 subclass zinc finger protein
MEASSMEAGAMSMMVVVAVIAATLLISAISIILPLAIWYQLRKTLGSTGGLIAQPYVQPMQWIPVQPATAPQSHLHGGILQIKKTQCRSCGASKVQQPKSAFIYCDYCGSLMDWDFRISITTAGSAKPGPEYQRLEAHVAPMLAGALSQGDRNTYRGYLSQVIDQHMRSCPASYSPRLGDPTYRAAMLEFQVCSILSTDFDPPTQALKAQFEHAQRTLQIYPRPGLPAGIEPQSFRRLHSAFLAHHERFMQVAAPCIGRHPDGASFELISTIQKSIFAQTYLRNLDKPEQDWLIEDLGLQAEYLPYHEQPTTERHCGGCGSRLLVLAGARRVLCEPCGHLNDVQHPEIACIGCGAPVSIPSGNSRFRCPHCQADLRAD